LLVEKWILPTISEVLAPSELTANNSSSTEGIAAEDWTAHANSSSPSRHGKERLKAEREWYGAIAALEQLLIQSVSNSDSNVMGRPLLVQGLVFVGPVPVLTHVRLLSSLSTWTFTGESLNSLAKTFQLPPASLLSARSVVESEAGPAGPVIPLLPGDPLAREQFCLVLTNELSLAIVLGELRGKPAFLFSFEPEVILQAWRFLRARVLLTNPQFPISQVDDLVEQYYPTAPDYRTVTQFSRLLLQHLPSEEAMSWGLEEGVDASPHHDCRASERTSSSHPSGPDVELLQAFAHEVRTPLTTIRTLTRLLLKRSDLVSDVVKRLKVIDRECTEQIDRMELLFRAAELETSTVKHKSHHLTAMSLAQVLQQSLPRWQQSATERNLTIDVLLPQQLPTVVSDPTMLDRVLTGLIENFTRSLPSGSHIQVQVIPTGDQLKLQLLSQSQPGVSNKVAEPFPVPPIRKSLGQLLMFQPETGNISLNLTATKQLFQAIGGKLIVRQRPQQGEVLTIFLPLEVGRTEFIG
jgi:signal transduction histidine kinase